MLCSRWVSLDGEVQFDEPKIDMPGAAQQDQLLVVDALVAVEADLTPALYILSTL